MPQSVLHPPLKRMKMMSKLLQVRFYCSMNQKARIPTAYLCARLTIIADSERDRQARDLALEVLDSMGYFHPQTHGNRTGDDPNETFGDLAGEHARRKEERNASVRSSLPEAPPFLTARDSHLPARAPPAQQAEEEEPEQEYQSPPRRPKRRRATRESPVQHGMLALTMLIYRSFANGSQEVPPPPILSESEVGEAASDHSPPRKVPRRPLPASRPRSSAPAQARPRRRPRAAAPSSMESQSRQNLTVHPRAHEIPRHLRPENRNIPTEDRKHKRLEITEVEWNVMRPTEPWVKLPTKSTNPRRSNREWFREKYLSREDFELFGFLTVNQTKDDRRKASAASAATGASGTYQVQATPPVRDSGDTGRHASRVPRTGNRADDRIADDNSNQDDDDDEEEEEENQ